MILIFLRFQLTLYHNGNGHSEIFVYSSITAIMACKDKHNLLVIDARQIDLVIVTWLCNSSFIWYRSLSKRRVTNEVTPLFIEFFWCFKNDMILYYPNSSNRVQIIKYNVYRFWLDDKTFLFDFKLNSFVCRQLRKFCSFLNFFQYNLQLELEYQESENQINWPWYRMLSSFILL